MNIINKNQCWLRNGVLNNSYSYDIELTIRIMEENSSSATATVVQDDKTAEQDNNNSIAVNQKIEQVPESQGHVLKREIGLIEGTALTVGAIVGSGIFISPVGILENVGSVGLSLIVWLASGIISIIGAVCYAELGTSFPSSGAEYHYLYVAFGEIPSFLFIWSSIMIFTPCNIAVLALSFAQYVIKPFFSSCDNNNDVPDSALRLLAAVAICIVIFINCFSVKLATKVQNVFGVTKVLSLCVIVVLGVIAFAQGKRENFQDSFKDSKTDVGSIALAFFSGIYAYGGANTLNYVTEEVKNPTKTIPRSIYISMAIVIFFYLLINACYFTVMTPLEMLASDAVANTFGDKTLGDFTWIIPVFVAVSTFGGLLINIFPYSRAILVGARNGHFPSVLSHIQSTQLTPMPSLIFMGLLSLVYLSTSNIFALINYAGFMYAIVAVGTAGAMLYLRWKLPEQPRPIKVSLFFPISYFIVSLFLFVLPMYVAPIEAAVGCAITLSGLPVYYLFIHKRKGKKPNKFQMSLANSKFIDSLTRFIQKLLVCRPAEEEEEAKIFD